MCKICQMIHFSKVCCSAVLKASDDDDSVFSLRVSWRYARGIITSDDSLFKRWQAPHLDRVVLDPVKEEDAGKTCINCRGQV